MMTTIIFVLTALVMVRQGVLLRDDALIRERRAAGLVEARYASLIRHATDVIMIADASRGEVQWVNAGHPAPRLIRADSTIVRLGPTGPMVSWLGGTWTMGTAALDPSDVLLAFTDGILESRDLAGAELGDDDLDTHLRTAAEQATDPAEVIAQVLATVRERADDLGRDDVTLVALRLDPQPTPRIPEPRR
jgi:serine phosphatase RsbU (regulator of sigma subunit)